MRRAGVTLIELLVVLGLLAILLGMAVPPVARWRDAFAVRAARDDLAAALAWTRLAATAGAGAALVVDPQRARYHTALEGAPGQGGGGTRAGGNLAERYGVAIDVPGGEAAATFEIRYDALGIGRVASRRIGISRGSARAELVISAYGRVRGW